MKTAQTTKSTTTQLLPVENSLLVCVLPRLISLAPFFSTKGGFSLKAGLHCDIRISKSINISITNVHTCCISTRKVTYASAMSSRMKPRGYWTSYVFKMADEDEILLLLLLLRRRRRRREQKRVNRKRSCKRAIY